MKIDLTDLKIIREIENGGRLFIDLVERKLNIKKDELLTRLARIESEGLVKNYQTSLLAPPFLGGDWFLGCGLCIASDPVLASERISQSVPFLVEVWQNLSLPFGIGPNLSFSFYSNEFPSSVQLLNELNVFDFLEVYKLRQYSFPVPVSLSAAEYNLLKEIYVAPTISAEKLVGRIHPALLGLTAEMKGGIHQELSWIREKLNRFVAIPDNLGDETSADAGILQILPEMDWRVCENFCHTHFIVEYPNSEFQIPDSEFQLVLAGRSFRERFYQLESDLWGFDQLVTKSKILQSLKINLKGLVFAESNRIINHWIPNLLE
jgi:DNA-binding Lrp family transcriptional regulator